MEIALDCFFAHTDGARDRSLMPHWSYSANAIFLPKALLPADALSLGSSRFSPGEFSFRVENARDITAFLDESAPKIEEMGLTLFFDDSG